MTAPQQEPHTPGVQESPNDQTGPNGPRTPSETTSDDPIGGGAQTGAAANAASEASAQGAQSGKPAANAAKAAAKATAKAAKAANKAKAKTEAAARTAAKTGAFKAKHQTFAKLFLNRFDRFSLSTKLVACTLIVWIVYPAMERAIARIPSDVMNVAFVGCLAFNLILQVLYLVEPAEIANAFTIWGQVLSGNATATFIALPLLGQLRF